MNQNIDLDVVTGCDSCTMFYLLSQKTRRFHSKINLITY